MTASKKAQVLSFDKVCELVAPVAKEYSGVEKIYLFGSRARGDGTEESDYDFCVYLDDTFSLFKLSGLRIDLVTALGCEVDIVDFTALKVGDTFIDEIKRDGVLVYER